MGWRRNLWHTSWFHSISSFSVISRNSEDTWVMGNAQNNNLSVNWIQRKLKPLTETTHTVYRCFIQHICVPGLLSRKLSVKSLLFLVLPAGHSPPSVWCKSSPAHRGLARVQSSDAPGIHSLCHSGKEAQHNQMFRGYWAGHTKMLALCCIFRVKRINFHFCRTS